MMTTRPTHQPSLPRRHFGAAAIALGLIIAALGVATAPGSVTAEVPRSQRVVMFTDSVGLGAKLAVPAAFPADWQVRVDGTPAEMVGEMEQNFVRPRLASNPEWFGDHVVIAAGYNFPYWDHDRFVREVDSMVATLTAAGVKHIYWMTLREVKPQYVSGAGWRQIQPYYWYFPDVNDLLEQALEHHPNLHLVDWAAVADQGTKLNSKHVTEQAKSINNPLAPVFKVKARLRIFATKKRSSDASRNAVIMDGVFE